MFERWPRFAHRHARLVLAGALVVLVPLAVLWSIAAGEYGSSFSVPGSEAQQLFDALRDRFPSNAGDQVTVVVKPAGTTPLTDIQAVLILNEAGLPPGVLNIVPGPARIVGETLLKDPRVRKIGFTGATSTGTVK